MPQRNDTAIWSGLFRISAESGQTLQAQIRQAIEQSITIMKNCLRALPEDGKLILVEAVVPQNSEPHFAKFIDLNMLVMTVAMAAARPPRGSGPPRR